MQFNETPKGDPEYLSAAGRGFESSADYERDRAEQRRQEAFAYLIETGRAKTPEEAERYLESLARLKERLLSILRENIPQTPQASQKAGEFPPYVYSLGSGGDQKILREPIEEILRAERLDRFDPRLWSLKVTVAPAAIGHRLAIRGHALLLPMVDRTIGISPDGYSLAESLNSQISQEEQELLLREYDLSRRELIENLRDQAGNLEEQDRIPIGVFWEPLFDRKRRGEQESRFKVNP